MKTILYISYMNLGESGTSGILKKVESQIKALEDSNLRVYYIYVEHGRLITNFINNYDGKIDNTHLEKSINILLTQNTIPNIEFAYIRFGGFSRWFFSFLDKLRRNNVNVLLEIPTYPFLGEYKQRFKDALTSRNLIGMRRAIRIIGTYPFYTFRAHNYVDRIVTYSDDKIIWGIDTIQTQNGVETNQPITHKFHQRDKSLFTMICVSSCMPWHGYDRVIEGMNEYYANGPLVQVNLNIVGDGPEIDMYKQLVHNYNLEDHVLFHGMLYGDKLNYLYAKSDIALDAMGRHRVGIYYNSSLKGKEYTLQGLPVVSGVKTELDGDNSFPYYMRVPADESPIKIDSILKFLIEVEEHVCYREEIQKYALDHYGFEKVMSPIIGYINSTSEVHNIDNRGG